MRSAVLFLALAAAVHAQATAPAIEIAILGERSADLRRGIEFGVTEMSRTAELLGSSVRIADDADGVCAFIAVSGGRGEAMCPTIHTSPLPASAGPCEFSVVPVARDEDAALWHPSLDKYGASELNERFEREFGSGMPEDAWIGWIAVKALVESALRRRPDESPCASLARLRLDGHKGVPLQFDAQTRVLLQPLYRVKDGRIVGEIK